MNCERTPSRKLEGWDSLPDVADSEAHILKQKIVDGQPRFVNLVPSDLAVQQGSARQIISGDLMDTSPANDRETFLRLLRKAKVPFEEYDGQFKPFNRMVTINGSAHTVLDFIFDKEGNIIERQFNSKPALVE